jgi:hypothetical protein
MSSLDFGAGSGTNTTRNYTLANFPVLPNSDWCIGFWIKRIVAPTSVQFPSMIGTNLDVGTVESFVVYDNSNLGQVEFDSRCNAGTLANAVHSGLPTTGDSTIYFVLSQRRSNNMEFYMTAKGASSSLHSASPAGTGTSTITATSFFIGRDNFAGRWFNPLGEVFVYTDRSLSAAQVTTLAIGARPNTGNVGGEPLVLLPFRSGEVSTETNLGTGGATYNATLTGTGFTTDTDFFDLVQNAAPTSTISSGSWTPSTGATLYGTIDEASADDADYDVDTSAGSTMEVKFAGLTDPASSTGHIVRYRISGESGTLTVSLRQGASTEIAAWAHTPPPSTPTTFNQTLSGAQADSITDYTDLRLRVVSS